MKWSSPEFEYKEKSNTWFLTVITIAVVIGLLALWQTNFLFLVFTAVAALMIIVWSQKKPKVINFELDDEGLWIERVFYSYNKFGAFAIKRGSLLFEQKERFRPHLIVSFDKKNLDAIRKHLLDFLPEMEYHESLIDALSGFFGF